MFQRFLSVLSRIHGKKEGTAKQCYYDANVRPKNYECLKSQIVYYDRRCVLLWAYTW